MKTILLLCVAATFLALTACNSRFQPASDQKTGEPKTATVTVDPNTAGAITGTIDFKGTPPKLASIDMTSDPGCPPRPQPSETVVVNQGKLDNVFVYIKDGLPQGSFAAPPEPVVLDQKGCRYIPHVMGIMVGQPFKILNTDTADHNIHDMPQNNPQWNESQMPTDKPIVKKFTNPEIMIPLECNQHPWMRAYISVLPHPYFAVSAQDGSFTIRNLPPGEYTLAAVHEKYAEQTMRVKIEPKKTAQANFAYTAAK